MWQVLGLFLLMLGGLGVYCKCIAFVRVTLPQNYGSNPGFGQFETMCLLWVAGLCIGLGLIMQSWLWGFVSFGIGFFLLGLLAMLLARLFGSD
jgi:hypothetical protein